MVKRNKFYMKEKKEIITKAWTSHERSSYEFLMTKTFMLSIPGSRKKLFQRRKLVDRSFLSI